MNNTVGATYIAADGDKRRDTLRTIAAVSPRICLLECDRRHRNEGWYYELRTTKPSDRYLTYHTTKEKAESATQMLITLANIARSNRTEQLKDLNRAVNNTLDDLSALR